ncbi:TPA: hypothetical protein ACYQN4_001092, partial [Escherichia coli]
PGNPALQTTRFHLTPLFAMSHANSDLAKSHQALRQQLGQLPVRIWSTVDKTHSAWNRVLIPALFPARVNQSLYFLTPFESPLLTSHDRDEQTGRLDLVSTTALCDPLTFIEFDNQIRLSNVIKDMRSKVRSQ